jgi:hypothetical protein
MFFFCVFSLLELFFCLQSFLFSSVSVGSFQAAATTSVVGNYHLDEPIFLLYNALGFGSVLYIPKGFLVGI